MDIENKIILTTLSIFVTVGIIDSIYQYHNAQGATICPINKVLEIFTIQIDSQQFCLWFCIEPVSSSVLGIYLSEERNMIVDEKFIRSLVL